MVSKSKVIVKTPSSLLIKVIVKRSVKQKDCKMSLWRICTFLCAAFAKFCGESRRLPRLLVKRPKRVAMFRCLFSTMHIHIYIYIYLIYLFIFISIYISLSLSLYIYIYICIYTYRDFAETTDPREKPRGEASKPWLVQLQKKTRHRVYTGLMYNIVCIYIYIYTEREREQNHILYTIHVYIHVYIYICIYVCIERERDVFPQRGLAEVGHRGVLRLDVCLCIYIYIYIYIYMYIYIYIYI